MFNHILLFIYINTIFVDLKVKKLKFKVCYVHESHLAHA
jgi:hypothetical protein